MPTKPRKTKTPALSRDAALDAVRRIVRSTGFDEEGQVGDRIHFGSREGGDMENDRADPALVRFALSKAKEIEAAVPGARARVEPVDEWVTIDVTLPVPGARPQKPLKVGDAVEIPGGLSGTLVGTIERIYNQGSAAESAEVRVPGYAPSYHPTRTLKRTRRRPAPKTATPVPAAPAPTPAPTARSRATLRPGDEVEYTNFTIGGSSKAKAIVTWDHGKSVEARTLGNDRIRLERASDGSLRRFT